MREIDISRMKEIYMFRMKEIDMNRTSNRCEQNDILCFDPDLNADSDLTPSLR